MKKNGLIMLGLLIIFSLFLYFQFKKTIPKTEKFVMRISDPVKMDTVIRPQKLTKVISLGWKKIGHWNDTVIIDGEKFPPMNMDRRSTSPTEYDGSDIEFSFDPYKADTVNFWLYLYFFGE